MQVKTRYRNEEDDVYVLDLENNLKGTGRR